MFDRIKHTYKYFISDKTTYPKIGVNVSGDMIQIDDIVFKEYIDPMLGDGQLTTTRYMGLVEFLKKYKVK